MCTNAYTIMEMKAHVSLGSQLQYLPHDSLAQIPPRSFLLKAKRPTVNDISETITSSFNVVSCNLYVSLLK
jgi:hypothetical protein